MPKNNSQSTKLAHGPSALLLAYYGDDFTGSTDVMEALSQAGLRTVLFLKPPTSEQLAKFPGLRAFGIAGGSRTMSPVEMDEELPPAFEALKASGAPIVHYKTCSTFDSTPQIGSIGKAIEIGRRVFGERPTPLVVGAPVLGRYVAFGNLFARSGLDTEPFRLDRHPTMSRHPVTPMKEADLRLILAGQTKLPVELVDVLKLEANREGRHVAGPLFTDRDTRSLPIVLFDTLRNEHLPVIGAAIEGMASEGQLFVVGSSGVEYALVSRWRERGFLSIAEEGERGEGKRKNPPRAPSSAVKQIVAVSGSCSPVTDRQIARAVQTGWAETRIQIDRLLDQGTKDSELSAARHWTYGRLKLGQNVAAYTCRGPADPHFSSDRSTREIGLTVSASLAEFLERVIETQSIRRAVVCGGDTSMHVARALGIEALEYLGPMAPGSPLCKVHAPGRVADGCEIVFKGGQVGRDRFFLDVLNGGPADD